MKSCIKKLTGILAAAMLVTGITACNTEPEHVHTWNSGEITTAATCTTAGVRTYTCSVCGETKTEEIAATGHKFAEEWSSDGTYHWHEATCGDTDEVSGKAVHDWGTGTETTAATYTSEGELTYTCSVCGKTKTEPVAKLTCDHNWGSGVVTTAATCTTAGVRTYTCSVCGETKIEEIAATGHTWKGTVNNSTISFVCNSCGETKTETKNFYETCTDAATGSAATSSSTYVYFGVFPNTVLASGSTVTVDETTSVTMGGNTYYNGSDGEYYAKVSENAFNSSYTYNDGTTVQKSSANSTRYFKVEPIKWKVLTTDYNSTGKALLLAEDILTANVPYNKYNSYSNTRTVDGVSGIYPNNYKYSQIRAYLNGLDYYYDTSSTETTKVETYNSKGFLQTAFTAAAQSLIATTTVDNSEASTTDAAGKIDKATSYYCADTQDKIFLLSEQEATTTSYGFAAYDVYKGDSNGTTESSRIRVTTDYAKANNAYQSSTSGCGGWWWLRSPYSNYSYSARCIRYDGNSSSDCVYDTFEGVIPALSISLQ